MEKSQWDLKRVCFGSNRLTRLDDFVVKYQSTHIALRKDYGDSKRAQRKVSILDYSYQQRFHWLNCKQSLLINNCG